MTVLFCPDLAASGYRPDAVDAIASAGRCVWDANNLPSPPMASTTTQSVAQLPMAEPTPAGSTSLEGILVLGAAGSIVLTGCIVAAWISYRWKPAPPLPTANPYLLPPGMGNQTHGIPKLQPMEFAGNSMEFAGNSQEADANSQNGESANSHGIPQVSADSQEADWQWPVGYENGFDPTKVEQPGEFEYFQRIVEQTGLNPKGNDIITRVWGVKPGRSDAFQRARDRRDTFAKRLEYYRSEGYFS